MTRDQQFLIFAKSTLKDCPDFLSERMVAALIKAGVDLPGELRAKFPLRRESENHRVPYKDS